MMRTALAALIGLFLVFVLSLFVASIIGLGPAEVWILPVLMLAAIALVVARRHRTARRRPSR
jgi:hypothetical protein